MSSLWLNRTRKFKSRMCLESNKISHFSRSIRRKTWARSSWIRDQIHMGKAVSYSPSLAASKSNGAVYLDSVPKKDPTLSRSTKTTKRRCDYLRCKIRTSLPLISHTFQITRRPLQLQRAILKALALLTSTWRFSRATTFLTSSKHTAYRPRWDRTRTWAKDPRSRAQGKLKSLKIKKTKTDSFKKTGLKRVAIYLPLAKYSLPLRATRKKWLVKRMRRSDKNTTCR